jgi:transposase
MRATKLLWQKHLLEQQVTHRWVVERALAWITRCRRTVRDYEWLPAHHETYGY